MVVVHLSVSWFDHADRRRGVSAGAQRMEAPLVMYRPAYHSARDGETTQNCTSG